MNDSHIVTDPDDMARAIRDLIEKLESGEVTSCSIRVYKADGTWEDVTFGETEAERVEALAALHQMIKNAH